MQPVISTNRLLLRQPNPQDLEFIFFMRSDPGVNRFIRRQLAKSVDDAKEWLDKITLGIEENRNFNWAISLPENGKMVGSVCLWNFSPDKTIAELGYDLHPDYQGKGIMAEAVDATLEFGFKTLNLQVIEAFTSRYNNASINLLLKKGFVLKKERSDEDNPDNSIYVLKVSK